MGLMERLGMNRGEGGEADEDEDEDEAEFPCMQLQMVRWV